MEQTTKGDYLNETFWSISEFADESAKRATGARNLHCGDDWYGVSTFDEAVNLAKHGWDDQLAEALELAESAVQTANQDHMMDVFVPVWDVTGAEVDVARYLQGEPECMIDFPLTKTSHSGRVITLVVSANVSGSISPDTIRRRGYVAVALAMALSRLGHAMEIWVDISNGSGLPGKPFVYQRVCVKNASDELDPARIMYALAHPSMLRCLFFGAWDGVKAGKFRTQVTKTGRGHVGNRKQRHRDLYPEGTIFLPELRSDSDVPDADQFLRKYLGELGLLAE